MGKTLRVDVPFHTYNAITLLHYSVIIIAVIITSIVISITLLFVHTQGCGNRIAPLPPLRTMKIINELFILLFDVDCTGLQHKNNLLKLHEIRSATTKSGAR